MKLASQSATWPLYQFAYFSGMAALVYEVAWTKMLALSFGRTTLAASSVLGGFMIGMGIGAWLYHRLPVDRFGALRIYAILELAIALAALCVTPVFAALPYWLGGIGAGVSPGLPMHLFRIGLVTLLILPPAALMGATYPALCAALIQSRDGVARHLGPIYGANTLGAASGALIAGFILVEHLGLQGSAITAVCLNLAIAALAWRLDTKSSQAPGHPGELDEDAQALPSPLPTAVTGLVLVGSGFATLAYEIIWFRALRYLFGHSTYALSCMLVVFLLGLGLGGLLCGRHARPEASGRLLGLTQLGIAVLAMGAIGIEALVLGDTALQANLSIFSPAVSGLLWWHRLAIGIGIAVVMMLPATLLMGFAFPLASRLLISDLRILRERVGLATFLSNLGSILGAILAALVILPALGSLRGTVLIALINVALGTAVLTCLSAPSWLRRGAPLAAATFVIVTALALPRDMPFNIGPSAGNLRMKLLFEEVGDLATVQVWAHPSRPDRRSMTVDGTPIGETRGLRQPIFAKQILLAHLPLTLAPDLRSTLNIGLGSATTVDALAAHPDVTLLDAVEISGAVARGSRFFAESRVLDDPRTRLHVEDVAHFLLQSPTAYDLIISDGKLGADFSGNALMLCRDFYSLASGRLTEQGLFIQWLPMAMPEAEFRVILRTFLASFPEVEIFFEDPGALFLVGSRSPIGMKIAGGPAAASGGPIVSAPNPRIASDLAELGIPSPEALLSRWVTSGDALRAELGRGRIASWDRSVFEYAIYRTTPGERRAARAENLALLMRAGRKSPLPAFLTPESPWVRSAKLIRQARKYAYQGRLGAARRKAQEAAQANPLDRRAADLAAQYQRGRKKSSSRRSRP